MTPRSSARVSMGQTLTVMSKRLSVLFAALACGALTPLTAGAQDASSVGFGSVSPGSGPPGTQISYTVAGAPDADSVCRGSSAFRTELLAGDGVLLATGGDTAAVPETATAGPGYLRLICYIPDATGRRVIHGFCAAFEILAAGSPAGAPTASGATPINDPCPASARVAVSQSLLDASTALGTSFNQIIKPLGG